MENREKQDEVFKRKSGEAGYFNERKIGGSRIKI